uniref:Uncharacterized protein n=1 Tax=Parascaris univalens TaxID=6257 RepID=A0A915CJR7_PARUN
MGLREIRMEEQFNCHRHSAPGLEGKYHGRRQCLGTSQLSRLTSVLFIAKPISCCLNVRRSPKVVDRVCTPWRTDSSKMVKQATFCSGCCAMQGFQQISKGIWIPQMGQLKKTLMCQTKKPFVVEVT